jgi:hypothetical protein
MAIYKIIRRKCGPKEKQEGVDQKRMEKKIYQWTIEWMNEWMKEGMNKRMNDVKGDDEWKLT